eukprot:UN04231
MYHRPTLIQLHLTGPNHLVLLLFHHFLFYIFLNFFYLLFRILYSQSLLFSFVFL